MNGIKSILIALIICTSFLPVLPFSSVSVNVSQETSKGDQPTCFVLGAGAGDPVVDTTQPNYIQDLITTFSIEGHDLRMLNQCWNGFDVQISPTTNDIFRVNQYYNFSVSVNVRQYGRDAAGNSTSDRSTFLGLITPQNQVMVKLILCDIHRSGICTPYVATTPAKQVNVTSVEELLNTDSTQSSGDLYLSYEIPAPAPDAAEFHSATPAHKVQLTPKINVTVDSNGTANVYTADGKLVSGPNSYVQQTANLMVSLNVSSTEDRQPRAFLLLAQVILFSSNFDDPTTIVARVDVANAMPDTILEIKDPIITQNSKAFRIASETIIAILVAIEVFLVGSVVYYRNHTVMQLSQWPLLAIMVAAAALATASSVLLIPVNNLRCYLQNLLIYVPVTLVGVILLSRIWRVNSILAPAQEIGRKGKKKNPLDLLLMDVLSVLSECNPWTCYRTVFVEGKRLSEINFHLSLLGGKGKNKVLRRSIPVENVVWLITVLMLPQVILQLCNLAVPSLHMRYEYNWNELMTVGKCYCVRSHMWTFYLGGVFALIPFVMTLLLSFFTRDLPSLFNESKCIFATARLVIVVILIGIPLLALTNDPAVSPDITVFLWMTLVNIMVFATSWSIMLEKLRIIWSGKKIVVSHLLRSTTRRPSEAGLPVEPSGVGIASGFESSSQVHSDGLASVEHMHECSPDDKGGLENNHGNGQVKLPEQGNGENHAEQQPLVIAVHMHKPLPSQLEKSVLYMKELLVRISGYSMTGMQVPKQELEKLKDKGKGFGDICARIVIVSDTEDG